MTRRQKDNAELVALRDFIKNLRGGSIVKITCYGLPELVARNIAKDNADESVQRYINWANSYSELLSAMNKKLLETERELRALKEGRIVKPTVRYDSHGESGNIFWILRALCDECKRMGISPTDYKEMQDRVFACGSYEEALAVIGERVNLIDVSKE